MNAFREFIAPQKRHLKLRNLTDWLVAINKNSVNGTGRQNENENEKQKQNESSPDFYRERNVQQYDRTGKVSIFRISMITFNGWISIETEEGASNVFEREKELVLQVEAALEKVSRYNSFCRVIYPGGNIQVQHAGAHNHDNGYSKDLMDFLEAIAILTPESYGIVYIHWPEHETLWNQFKVYKLALGKITVEDDIYLSPCNPTIERSEYSPT